MQKSLLEMSADIVAAQARQNSMGMDEMAESLRKVFYTLQEIQQSADGTSSEDTGSSDSLDHLRRNPTESIQRNQIICLESGKPYKLLSNRHLALYGMTPRANNEKRSSAPPVNRLNTSMMVPCCESINCIKAAGFTPGTGIKVPMRYMISATSTNSKR